MLAKIPKPNLFLMHSVLQLYSVIYSTLEHLIYINILKVFHHFSIQKGEERKWQLIR